MAPLMMSAADEIKAGCIIGYDRRSPGKSSHCPLLALRPRAARR
jgi:hypothetical protein